MSDKLKYEDYCLVVHCIESQIEKEILDFQEQNFPLSDSSAVARDIGFLVNRLEELSNLLKKIEPLFLKEIERSAEE